MCVFNFARNVYFVAPILNINITFLEDKNENEKNFSFPFVLRYARCIACYSGIGRRNKH